MFHTTHAILTNGIVISCQAPEGSPLRDPHVMARMAEAADLAGAVGIRAEGDEDIRAIASVTTLPIIGIRKHRYSGSDVYITATVDDVDLVADAGARIVALDATRRQRPHGELLSEIIAHANSRGLEVLADLSNIEDAPYAIDAGADYLGTTLVPESSADVRPHGPNIEIVARLAAAYPDRQIIAEGRYATPADIKAALTAGALNVVIGRAATDMYALAADFVAAAHESVQR